MNNNSPVASGMIFSHVRNIVLHLLLCIWFSNIVLDTDHGVPVAIIDLYFLFIELIRTIISIVDTCELLKRNKRARERERERELIRKDLGFSLERV